MASSQTNYYYPHFAPPPTPTIRPPPPPSHFIPPPPSHFIPPPPPHALPPPPPHALPPPPPHAIAPPPPHVFPPPPPHVIPPPPPSALPPPPPPGGHTTVIVVVFVSLGSVFFLAFLAIALCCFMKKRKKKSVQETEILHIDEHRKVKEEVVQGPHGTQATVVTIEDDIHIDEEIRKNEMMGKGTTHLKSGDNDAAVVAGMLESGEASSSSGPSGHGRHLL